MRDFSYILIKESLRGVVAVVAAATDIFGLRKPRTARSTAKRRLESTLLLSFTRMFQR